MSDSKLLELPYERIAMAGGEMPSGMEYHDQILFLQLRLLYNSYRRSIIDRETATREKIELLKSYESHKNANRIGKELVGQIKQTELARAEYRKNPCHENAMKLVETIEGRQNI